MENFGLKRVLGLAEVSFIAIGFMIGGGVFVFTGIVLKITGPALPLAYAFAAIPVFMTTLPMAMLGSAIPSTGANYKYPCRMFSPCIAFVGVWTYALSAFFGQIPLLAKGCSTYLETFFPNIQPIVFSLGLVTVFYIINLLGIKFAAVMQGLLVIILISALLLFGGKGIVRMDPVYFNHMLPNGVSSLLLGTSLLTFTYFGANAIIELGGEIKDPGKIIPRAITIAFSCVTLVYILVAVATVGTGSITMLTQAQEPLLFACDKIFSGPGRIFFILGGAVIALTTTLNALFITGTKSLLVIIEDGLLPKSLGKISERFRTPYRALTLFWCFSILGIFADFSLDTLASYASLGAIVIMIPIQLVSLGFAQKYPDLYERAAFKLKGIWQYICPLTGILIGLFFGVLILVDLGTVFKIGGFVLFIGSGLIYFYIRKNYLMQQMGIDVNSLKYKTDW